VRHEGGECLGHGAVELLGGDAQRLVYDYVRRRPRWFLDQIVVLPLRGLPRKSLVVLEGG
jgi:hypothetical protein